ncbi:probable protein phosphatase 2C 76 isoform X4 [Abrus precatorius]|uniref:Probable protein phosphatase 2C 76 isoform X4 n=1 Tax=Abrus precatorius TaxID=3816 RepID=A0A8B8LZX7_ABRPR|nr:probable protein phosphatase 2C 76 isoform X4 [Abrus precatorius]
MVCGGDVRSMVLQLGIAIRFGTFNKGLSLQQHLNCIRIPSIAHFPNRGFKTITRVMDDNSSMPRVATPVLDIMGFPSGAWKSSEDGRLSCGYSSFRGKRVTMEDFYDIKTSKIDGRLVSLFGIFDGETYQQTDADFLDYEKDTFRDDGSTASTAVLVDNHLYVANVGDSRTIISKAGKAIALSEDHKPNRSDERKRIENAGGVVMWAGTWRVGGVLAMSRAFGNRMLKPFVVAEPEIQDQEIDEETELLVLASDGLWDVVPNDDAVSLVRTEEEAETAARKLTEAAFTRGSADNITCIVVRFNHEKAYPVNSDKADPASSSQHE